MFISHLSADAELLGALRAGDARAFDWLVARYESRLIEYTRYLTGAGVDAEDITQRTFLSLWQMVSKGRLPDNLRSWLYRVAHNHACDVQRRRYRLPTASFEAANDARYAQDSLDDVDRSLFVRGILDGLSEHGREIIYLRCFQDLTFEEIGRYLGIRRQSAHGRFKRALQQASELTEE